MLIDKVLTALFGSQNERDVKKLRPLVAAVNAKEEPVVFMLWGNFAKKKAGLITNPHHLILTSGHPSPLSARYFLGNNHFKKCNEFLVKNGMNPIDWRIR